jgi:hypothetical protein
MPNRKTAVAAALTCASLSAILLTAACQEPPSGKAKDPVVKVGRVTIGKSSFELVRDKVARISPVAPPYYYPAQRQPVTYMAECEAIYQHIKQKGDISAKLDSSLEWKWKRKYFTASLYFDLLQVNLGFTDAELEAYYKKSAEKFRATAQTADGQDSSYVPPFEAIKRQVAEEVFYENYKPDSAFLARLEGQDDGDGNARDSAAVRNYWLYNVRTNAADFYMRQIFFEKNGEPYADSVQQFYGEGKPIQSADIDVIRSWAAQNRNSAGMKELLEWLYKWEVFAERAEKMGLTKTPEYKELIHWATRIEYAQIYLREGILPNFSTEMSESDAELAELLIYDQMRSAENRPDERRLRGEFDNMGRLRVMAAVDSAVYAVRKKVGIAFLQDEPRDERGADPAALAAKADSLRDAASDMDRAGSAEQIEQAEGLLRTLATEFFFSPEGRRAAGDLAKMNVDKYGADPRQDRLLWSAVSLYRRSMVLDPADAENMCNGFFMIGFIYDEHLKLFSLAEANYKWILRNAPDCALASDAEFMLLNLDEPMTSIEEIQGRSLRQGRKVDFDETDGGEAAAL